MEAIVVKAGIAKKVHAAKTAGEAVMLAQSFKADVVVVDAKVPDLPPEHCLVKLKKEVPAAALLMVTESLPAKKALALSRCGCTGFLHTSFTADELLTAIHKTLGGDQYYSAQFANDVANHMLKKMEKQKEQPMLGLTDIEIKVMHEIYNGRSNTEIAAKLNRHLKTIETTICSLYKKLGASNRVEAVIMALRKGVVVDLEI